MRWRWRRVAAAVLLATLATPASAPAPAPTSAPADSTRACAANPLCRCRADHLTCDYVPFYRFPQTEPGVAHVALWAARLGALAEAALDGRPLRTLVLVAARLHALDGAALASMSSSLASLDLGYNEFTEAPVEALRHLKVLNWLNLQNNYISDIDPSTDWGGLADSLSSLSLSNNHISTLRAGALTALHQLAQLELDGNRIRQLDPGALPPALSLLRLSENLILQIPCQALALLPRLRHLHIRNNALQPTLNATCSSDRSKIDSLDLSHNELADNFQFPFQQGLQLKQLILDLNDFTTLPQFVLDCGRLEKLSVSYNNVQHISDATLHGLKRSLERLELDHNELINLPGNLRDLTRLRYLSVSYNRLEDITNLPPKLHSLSLAGNYLTSFPPVLFELSPASLAYLDLGYNQISYVGAAVFGAWSDRLSTLSLRGNRIAQLTVGSFPPLPLRELVLSFNDLYYVEADVFANLSDLRVLELSLTLFSGEVPSGSSLHSLSWLSLDNNNIHYISSDDIQNYPSLEYLNLDFNKIVEFPSEVGSKNNSYKLKDLRLAYNYVQRLNSEFLQELLQLQSLDLSNNRVHNISERCFINLLNLEYLSLAQNVVELIADAAFINLPKLEVLDIQENSLVEFSLRYFENVSNDDVNFSINASYNRITSLAGGQTVPINSIDLSNNLIENISKGFFDAMGKHIRQIFLSHNKLTHIDSTTFGSLPSLNILNLHDNNIVSIKRRAFAEMPALQILVLSDNQITQLSVEQFHTLHRLRHLRLECNKLRAIPRDTFKNTMLEYLDISDNQLSLFPSSALAQVGFTLRRLELSRNRIEYLDAAMFHTTAFLHELGLAHNALTVLSDNTFAGLSRLHRLDISYNAIKTNFKELFHNTPKLRRLSLAGTGLKMAPHLPLRNLTELNLSNNYITSYSESDMRHLSNLRALDISGNRFTSLRPAMWGALPNLISLDVSSNPIVRMPRGLFDGLDRLLHLKMNRLVHLETLEPRAFRSLPSLRSLSLESLTRDGQKISVSEIVLATPFLEALVIYFRENAIDSQLSGLRAPKLRSLELSGGALRRVGADAFQSLGHQRALTLRLVNTSITELPAGLARPLARVPHLALDFSDNKLVSFESAVLYPNHTGWNRLATKLLPGGLGVAGNPLRCGCPAAWVGAWLRRWAREVGGGARGARAAAGRAACFAPRAPLLALPTDEAGCRARALSARSPRLLARAVLLLLAAALPCR